MSMEFSLRPYHPYATTMVCPCHFGEDSTTLLTGSVGGYHVHSRLSLRLCHVPVLIDFLLTVKAATLIFISGHGSAISSAKEGKSGFIYNVVKNRANVPA